MHLTDLLADPAAGARAGGNPEIAGLALDSRHVGPGYLFAALPGTATDGSRFIGDAVARGAVAVLAAEGTPAPGGGIAFITDADPRRRLADLAARFYPRQPRHIAAVTGTNGKTSVVQFTRQIWQQLELRSATIGTLGAQWRGHVKKLGTTTPDAIALHRLLDRLAGKGVDHVAIEASSHGLAQHRLSGARVGYGAFTNLSHDHLDYHADEEDYLRAKLRLFSEVLRDDGWAVLNADSPLFERFAEVCRARGARILAYGRAGADIRWVDNRATRDGQQVTIEVAGVEYRITVPLVGEFQVANALCALGLALASGNHEPACVHALERLVGVPGRLEKAAEHPAGAPIFVDYAHTPDALAQALAALRPHTAGRLHVVFGAGGDRDRTKRPAMGRVAAEGADVVIVTDDNPRNEDPATIRGAILAGCAGAAEIGDRAEAIRSAVRGLAAGDMLLIAGKGHERGQIVGARVFPFDDVAQAKAAVADIAEGAS